MRYDWHFASFEFAFLINFDFIKASTEQVQIIDPKVDYLYLLPLYLSCVCTMCSQMPPNSCVLLLEYYMSSFLLIIYLIQRFVFYSLALLSLLGLFIPPVLVSLVYFTRCTHSLGFWTKVMWILIPKPKIQSSVLTFLPSGLTKRYQYQ